MATAAVEEELLVRPMNPPANADTDEVVDDSLEEALLEADDLDVIPVLERGAVEGSETPAALDDTPETAAPAGTVAVLKPAGSETLLLMAHCSMVRPSGQQ